MNPRKIANRLMELNYNIYRDNTIAEAMIGDGIAANTGRAVIGLTVGALTFAVANGEDIGFKEAVITGAGIIETTSLCAGALQRRIVDAAKQKKRASAGPTLSSEDRL